LPRLRRSLRACISQNTLKSSYICHALVQPLRCGSQGQGSQETRPASAAGCRRTRKTELVAAWLVVMLAELQLKVTENAAPDRGNKIIDLPPLPRVN